MPFGDDVVALLKETHCFDVSISASPSADSKKLKCLAGAKTPTTMTLKVPCYTNVEAVPRGTHLCLSSSVPKPTTAQEVPNVSKKPKKDEEEEEEEEKEE